MKRILFIQKYTHDLLLLLGLFILSLIANSWILQECPLFMEQAPLYLANQKINTLFDLVNVYIHPQMLYSNSIPFFRPSGHFLLYQLITPVTGWHNLRAFFIVNFFFLAATGLLLIKIYALLFPNYTFGGYFAFALFMAHPALALSRMMIMQFEYACTCFVLLSFYCFILFTKKNVALNTFIAQGNLTHKIKSLNFSHLGLLGWSLIFYVIAITFKETALLLAPLLCFYLIVNFAPLTTFMSQLTAIFLNRQFYKILALICFAFFSCFLYLSQQWQETQPHLTYTLNENIIYYLMIFFGIWESYKHSIFFTFISLPYSYYTQFIWLLSLTCLGITLYHLTTRDKISLFFLLCATFIFSLMPFIFGGLPWHLLLAILFLTLALGFSLEYWLRYFFQINVIRWIVLIFLLAMALDMIFIDTTLQFTESHRYPNFILNRNALWRPPILKDKINKNTILVVASNSDYAIGASLFPLNNSKELTSRQKGYFLKPTNLYNGTLFRWSYLMPQLREMVYQFDVNHLQAIPNEIFYLWLQHMNNIYVIGYDNKGNWHDLTELFKRNLIVEQTNRHKKQLTKI